MVLFMLAVGLVLGGVVGWVLAQPGVRSEVATLRNDRADAVARATVAEQLLTKAQEDVVFERSERERVIANLDATFESTSNRVLEQTVQRFEKHQEDVAVARDQTLKANLDPIQTLLRDYEASLVAFDKQHVEALAEVRERTNSLLETQLTAQAEVKRLNQLLGRSDHRGRWGEVQLANVLEASGLKNGVDFSLQSASTADSGVGRRPDCIVHLPNDTHVFIDAKFPFAAFEQSLAATDLAEITQYRREHATALRGHVRELAGKSYWANESGAPKYTVCFVPSDAALSAAFDADPTLYDFAVQQGVLIAGPTNLMALLWSAHLVLREHERLANVEKILDEASKLPDLIRLVATPIVAMGSSLDKAVGNYNSMVASVEGRLIPAARRMQKLGVGVNTKPMPEIGDVSAATRSLNATKWAIGPSTTGSDLAGVLDVDDDVVPIGQLEAGDEPSE